MTQHYVDLRYPRAVIRQVWRSF